VTYFTRRFRCSVLIWPLDHYVEGHVKMSRYPTATLNLLILAAALLVAGNMVLLRPSLPSWFLPLARDAVSAVLACPYLMPPECVEPIPGL
jgi:hypothetical protein